MSTSTNRTVRVFLSSTFRDFAEERDLLVKKVFPELRRLCRERQVELVDVDLRWGITEEQAQRGEVLPICLAEIDRSRPYFMGFIGDRYGWVPEKHQYDLSLLVEQPWLDEHRGGKSVTELEMLHGVLNNPQMKDRAFFYFRNSEYSQSKGGPYLSEGPESALKLEALKDRIRTSGFPVVENYLNPEALAEKVREDLWRVIDEAFPEEEVPDPLTLERRKHEAYGGSRLGLYLGGKQYFQSLDAAMGAESFKPVLITGASGGGKSALIANWSKAYRDKHPETLEIVHYLGSGADAADPVKLVTRLLQEIARITGDELKLESDPRKILDALPEWLARASSYAEREGKEWFIMLDGLDKLSSLRDLRWWPGFLPPRVKLVVSCLDGEVQDEARKRMEWSEIKVTPLTDEDKKELIVEYLGRYRKSLTPEQTGRVLSHPLSGNPLFLRTLLEELRIFGVYEELEARMSGYLDAETIDGLFAKVFARVEEDNRAGDVRSAMEVLWGSLESFAEDELLAITGLVPAVWSPILNALSESLISTNGRLALGHDYFRKAVEDRYLTTEASKQAVYKRLSDFCAEAMKREGRKANSPYVRRQAVRHYLMAEDWDQASNALSDLDYIEARARNREQVSLLTDYAIAEKSLPEGQAERKLEEERQAELDRYAREMVEYAATCTRIREGSGEAEPILPRPVPSVRMWTEEEIEVERIRRTDHPNRLDKVRAFKLFVATNTAPISDYSGQEGFLANLARNDDAAGPVHQEGERKLKRFNGIKLIKQFHVGERYNPIPACLTILEGHEDRIYDVALSADGKTIVSGSADKTVRIWDMKSGSCIRVLKGHQKSVGSIALSMDGRKVVSGSDDKTIRIWDKETGECLKVLEGHKKDVTSVAFTNNYNIIVSGSYDTTLRIWDGDSGKCLKVLEGHQKDVYAVSISSDGRWIASGSLDKTVRIWNTETGECIKVLEGHENWINSVAFFENDGRIVSGGSDGIIRFWDAETGECLKVIAGHSSNVRSIALSSDGTRIVSGSTDQIIRIWDAETGECHKVLKGNQEAVGSVSMIEDGSKIVSGGWDKTIRIWNSEMGACPLDSHGHQDGVMSMAFSSDEGRMVSGSLDNSVRLWNTETRECVKAFEGHKFPVYDVALSWEKRRIVSASGDGTVRIWDAESGECLNVLRGEDEQFSVSSVALSSSAEFIASGHAISGNVRIWNSVTGECLKVLKGHKNSVRALALSRDGRKIFSGDADNLIRIWDLELGVCLKVLEGHTGYVESLELSNDGRILISGSNDYSVRIWDAESGECLKALEGHKDNVNSVGFLGDGRNIVSASDDNSLRIWNAELEECLGVFFLRGLTSVGTQPGFQKLATGFRDGRVGFYDLQNLN